MTFISLGATDGSKTVQTHLFETVKFHICQMAAWGGGWGGITFVRKFEEGMDNETAAAADALTIMWIASNVVT